MTKNPRPRTSALAGSTPSRPAAPASSEPQAPAPAAGREVAAPKSQKGKVGFYMYPEAVERAKRAWKGTQLQTGIGSWTEFIETAVHQYMLELEREHNESKPF